MLKFVPSLYRPQLEEAVLLVWRDEGRRSANASLRMHRKDPKFEVVRIGNSYYRLGSLLTTGFIGFELCQFGFMCFHGRLLCGFVAMEAWIWEFQRRRKLVVDENLKFKCEECCWPSSTRLGMIRFGNAKWCLIIG